MNLRERVESDLSLSLEGQWGLPVTLLSPDGVLQTLKKGATTPLLGQVLYDTLRINPETGEEMVVSVPVVALRRSSLDRIPLAGENWIVAIPEAPSLTATMRQYALSPTRPPEGGASVGFIRLYLQQLEESV